LDTLINNDYEFLSLRRGGVYFAKQGEFWLADVLGNCEISVKDFKKGELGKFVDWQDRGILNFLIKELSEHNLTFFEL